MADNEELIKDLVCGMEKPKSEMKLSSFYKGETYYFCSGDDKSMFEANPEHWVPKGVS